MNVFERFHTKTKVIKVKALDNAEVTIRELTVHESNDYYKKLVSDSSTDGKINFNYKEIFTIKLEKVANCMVEPKMSIEELKSLSDGASEAITEIAEAIDALSSEGKKKK
jgi:hypothetical protein